MSWVFGIDFRFLSKLPASRSMTLLRELEVGLDGDDEDYEGWQDEGYDTPPPSHAEALRHIIMGEPIAGEWADIYASVMVHVVRARGRTLDVASHPPWHTQAVDLALRQNGIASPISMGSLFFRGIPVL